MSFVQALHFRVAPELPPVRKYSPKNAVPSGLATIRPEPEIGQSAHLDKRVALVATGEDFSQDSWIGPIPDAERWCAYGAPDLLNGQRRVDVGPVSALSEMRRTAASTTSSRPSAIPFTVG
jgi:hypothetical protein